MQVHAEDAANTLSAGTELMCMCTAEGAVAIRQVRGLALANEADLHMLGPHRRRRHLYEVVILPTSTWVGKTINAEKLREVFGCGHIAIRGRQGLDVEIQANDVVL